MTPAAEEALSRVAAKRAASLAAAEEYMAAVRLARHHGVPYRSVAIAASTSISQVQRIESHTAEPPHPAG